MMPQALTPHYSDNPRDDRRHRNGHILELQSVEWRCIHCHHWFDALSDADEFWCGDDCTSAHARRVVDQQGA